IIILLKISKETELIPSLPFYYQFTSTKYHMEQSASDAYVGFDDTSLQFFQQLLAKLHDLLSSRRFHHSEHQALLHRDALVCLLPSLRLVFYHKVLLVLLSIVIRLFLVAYPIQKVA